MLRVEGLSLEAMRRFRQGSEKLEFRAESSTEVYAFIARILRAHAYPRLPKPERGSSSVSSKSSPASAGRD